MTERERYWWRPGSDAIDTVAEHHDGSLTSHHPKGHGPVELAESGATVNAVCPVGAADAGMGREVLELKVLATSYWRPGGRGYASHRRRLDIEESGSLT